MGAHWHGFRARVVSFLIHDVATDHAFGKLDRNQMKRQCTILHDITGKACSWHSLGIALLDLEKGVHLEERS